ncbi:snapalysin family zinc-dependent metalloprotease [Lentzea sp. NPDC058450]|uniref:snapalysin family zinc-dependent metalloprotease n=1 Tax=Lentzea sp. NPDC058450 TaxID=3346505 RepID=UPI00366279FE
MSIRKLLTAATGLTMLALVAAPVTATAAPAESTVAVRAITVSGGAEYSQYVGQATQIWNSHVPNIRMSQVGSGGNITITVGSGGGSRASIGHGSGWIFLDRQQINQGYSPLRVVTHEMGHSLGLRDNYNRDCSILMSGGSAGTSCRNVNPSAAEANWVNRSFAGGRASTASTTDEVAVWSGDCWATPPAYGQKAA